MPAQFIEDTRAAWHMHDDVSVFVVWHISTAGMLFDISARNLAYQQGPLPTFGISLANQWESVRFDFVKHTGVLGLVQRR